MLPGSETLCRMSNVVYDACRFEPHLASASRIGAERDGVLEENLCQRLLRLLLSDWTRLLR